jgi:hypothetical protein
MQFRTPVVSVVVVAVSAASVVKAVAAKVVISAVSVVKAVVVMVVVSAANVVKATVVRVVTILLLRVVMTPLVVVVSAVTHKFRCVK